MQNEFEWDESKRLSTLKKHKIDFEDAIRIFDDRRAAHVPSRYPGEDRWLTIGDIDGLRIMVVWTLRGTTKRIITARRIGKNDRGKYYTNDPGGSAPEQG